MLVNCKNYRTVWMKESSVFLIEQNLLPFEFKVFEAKTYLETCFAIENMIVRGAGAIGATAGYAMTQATIEAPENDYLTFITNAKARINSTRPTAQNLFYATERVFNAALKSRDEAILEAEKIAMEDIRACQQIGIHGNSLITQDMKIETHCNAGWLAFVDYGSALSPIYMAQKMGKNPFVYVDETRPRSQGARLTAWELRNEHVNHKIIPDNAAAHYMSKGMIDMVIVGADRIAANGDVANKIGTLEKAICAREYNIPFYVAAPISTIDINCKSGLDIPIEERNQDEVLFQTGIDESGNIQKILTCSPGSKALNPAFDVTPAKFISGIITEKGIIQANEKDIKSLF